MVTPLLLGVSIYFHYCKHVDSCLDMGPKQLELLLAIKSKVVFFILYHLTYILSDLHQLKEYILHNWGVEHGIVVKTLSLSLLKWLGTLSMIYFTALSMRVIMVS